MTRRILAVALLAVSGIAACSSAADPESASLTEGVSADTVTCALSRIWNQGRMLDFVTGRQGRVPVSARNTPTAQS
jgi:hypothetical protein